MKINREKYFLGALYIGIVGLGLSIFVFSIQTMKLMQKDFSSQLPIVQFKTFINKKGEQWNLPLGKYNFVIAQAATNEGPIFLEGEIDPPDVHVGDTQWLRVIVQSSAGIKQVTAHIETDTGIKELPLNKVGSVSYLDMIPNKYLVKNGVLEILSTKQAKKLHGQKIAAEKKSFFSKASAQDGEKEKWENSWIVHDTHNTTYKTTFVVEDNAGLTNTLTLAWSDLCGIPINGDYKDGAWKLEEIGSCTVSVGQLDGIERGDVIIGGGGTLTVDGTFVFNSGKKIDLTAKDGSKISIWENGQIKKTSMWYCDTDGDGYTPTGQIGTIYAQDTKPACGGGGGGGFNNLLQRVVKLFKPQPTLSAEICGPTTAVYAVRRYIFNGNESLKDCDEGSQYAHEGSTVFCEIPRGGGSFDYNCDLSITKQFTTIASCGYAPQGCYNGCYSSCNQFLTPGWKDSPAPDCGHQGIMANICYTNGDGFCGEDLNNGNPLYCSGSRPYNCLWMEPRGNTTETQPCR